MYACIVSDTRDTQASELKVRVHVSTKQEAQAHVKAFFASNSSDDVISATQLTDMIATVTERDYSAKTVRARLRKEFTRKSELKNSDWRITATIASSELAYYMTRNVKAS